MGLVKIFKTKFGTKASKEILKILQLSLNFPKYIMALSFAGEIYLYIVFFQSKPFF